MGKLRSNRVKRIPQVGITSDRYNFLGLNQAEPNLGDPKVGPSSVGANPIKAGSFYQLAAIGEYPGERFWTTNVGIGSTLGVISVYANDVLPNSAFERIHGLNFVGTGVTIETPPLELFNGIGIATVRFTVTDILNQGPEGQILYNGPGGLVGSANQLYYSSDNVGIGTTIPQYKLDVLGNSRFDGKVNAGGTDGAYGQYLSATGAGITWSTFPVLRTGFTTIATQGQTGFSTTYNVGFLDVFVNGVRLSDSDYIASNGSIITLSAPCFGGEVVDIIAYNTLSTGSGIGEIGGGGTSVGGTSQWVTVASGIYTGSNVGIGTTNPQTKLQVGGVLGFGAGNNIRIGDNATGSSITSGSNNFFAGISAGQCSQNGSDNNFFGRNAGYHNTTGSHNNFFGKGSGFGNPTGITGTSNNFFGCYAGASIKNGSYNNFFGWKAGYCSTDAYENNFLGDAAGFFNTTGSYNNFLGCGSGNCNTVGSRNNFFGWNSGYCNSTGSNNIFLGSYTGISDIASNKIIFGRGYSLSSLFDSPSTSKDNQFAVGLRTDTNPSKYWLVGDENFNVGIGTTNPTTKLHVGGTVLSSGGFISVGNTSPVQILLSGNQLIFNVVGIGSTSLTLI